MAEMTEEEIDRMAREVEDIQHDLAPLLTERNHLAAAMALTLMAAHHVLHDGASEEDFANLTVTAWKRSLHQHATCST